MVNYQGIIKGLIFFILACFIAIIVYQIGTTMLDATTTTGDTNALTTDQQAIIWLGMIIIWVLTLVILPAHFIIEALKDKNEGNT